MVKETCVMTFETARGPAKTVRINDPRPNISAHQVIAAAINIMDKDVFDSSVGRLGELVGAVIIRETTTVLYPAA